MWGGGLMAQLEMRGTCGSRDEERSTVTGRIGT